MIYHATFSADDNGTLLVHFPDVPAAITFGVDERDARLRARNALAAALEIIVERKQALPAPSFTGGCAIQLRGLHAAKIALHVAMRESRVTKAALAKRLGLHPSQVDLLLDFKRASRLDALEDALDAVKPTPQKSSRKKLTSQSL